MEPERTIVGDDSIPFCFMCRKRLVRGPGGRGRRFVLVGDPPRRAHVTCAETFRRDEAEDAITARPRVTTEPAD